MTQIRRRPPIGLMDPAQMGPRPKSTVPMSKIPCRVCGKRITKAAARHGDPFCTRVCAEQFYAKAAAA